MRHEVLTRIMYAIGVLFITVLFVTSTEVDISNAARKVGFVPQNRAADNHDYNA